MNLKLILVIAGIVLAALWGIRFGHEKELAQERARVKRAEKEAKDAQHTHRAEKLKRKREKIERDMARERTRPLADRVRESVAEAKRRQAG